MCAGTQEFPARSQVVLKLWIPYLNNSEIRQSFEKGSKKLPDQEASGNLNNGSDLHHSLSLDDLEERLSVENDGKKRLERERRPAAAASVQFILELRHPLHCQHLPGRLLLWRPLLYPFHKLVTKSQSTSVIAFESAFLRPSPLPFFQAPVISHLVLCHSLLTVVSFPSESVLNIITRVIILKHQTWQLTLLL